MKPLVQCFSDDLMEMVGKYRGEGITYAEAIGALELVKLDLFMSMVPDDEEPG